MSTSDPVFHNWRVNSTGILLDVLEYFVCRKSGSAISSNSTLVAILLAAVGTRVRRGGGGLSGGVCCR